MFRNRLFMLCALGAMTSGLRPAADIVLYLQSAPYQVTRSMPAESAYQEIDGMLGEQPSHLSAIMLEGALSQYAPPAVGGFLGVYNGYGDFANTDGLLNFPLRHLPASKLFLLITPNIELVRAQGNTIAHAQIPEHVRDIAVRYEFIKSKDVNDIPFWQVQKSKLPVSSRITGRTLTLVSDPRNIYVAEGVFRSHASAHMLLPRNVYVVGRRQQTRSLLSSLDLLRFHEPIEYAQAIEDELRHKAVMTNQ